jgi:hypothetical protein
MPVHHHDLVDERTRSPHDVPDRTGLVPGRDHRSDGGPTVYPKIKAGHGTS